MLILSQSKLKIVNFSQVIEVNVEDKFMPCLGDKNKYAITVCSNRGTILLGTYATNERAKEVLCDMYYAFLTYKIDPSRYCDTIFNPPKHYEMPQV